MSECVYVHLSINVRTENFVKKNTAFIVVQYISLELLQFFFFRKKHSLIQEIFYIKLKASKIKATACGRVVRNGYSDRRTIRYSRQNDLKASKTSHN